MTNRDGPTALERFINGILPENPTFRQILGICPTLAVTNSVKGAVTMAGAVAFVLVGSNIVTSLLRRLLKPHLRILVFTLTIAAFVTMADRFLAAYMYEMSKQLGPYVPLIIVNCIIIARCEVCASRQGVIPATADAVGQSIGHALGLVAVATVREILGSGTWFGIDLGWASEKFDPYKWAVMILPPGAFFTLGILIGMVNWIGAARAARARGAPNAR
jgi:electron transport complex protein RnfE